MTMIVAQTAEDRAALEKLVARVNEACGYPRDATFVGSGRHMAPERCRTDGYVIEPHPTRKGVYGLRLSKPEIVKVVGDVAADVAKLVVDGKASADDLACEAQIAKRAPVPVDWKSDENGVPAKGDDVALAEAVAAELAPSKKSK